MATLQEQIASLNDAIASGTRSVTLGGQTITYNTTTSLIAARNDFVRQLADETAALSGTRRKRQFLMYQNGRGFGGSGRASGFSVDE